MKERTIFILIVICIVCIIINQYNFNHEAHSLGLQPPQSKQYPVINDPDLKIELVAEGFQLPSSMAFTHDNDILVLEKETGLVKLIDNGKVLDKPVIDLNVATEIDRGLLGVSFANNNEGNDYVFLYYTETDSKDGEDVIDGKDPLGNRLYRYVLEDNKLVQPKLLLDLPVMPNRHPGGQIQIGPDDNVYIAIGDLDQNGQAQNNKTGMKADGTSGILRITQNGESVGKGILGDSFPLNLYYAYGIRNSFGIDFDPLTGNLWDTENGPDYGDEINLVKSGFNSGWRVAQGIWIGQEEGNIVKVPLKNLNNLDLVDFGGKGVYSEPELTWSSNVGPTALEFLTSDKLGEKYQNDIFSGDFNNGYLYHFKLDEKRTGLYLEDELKDRVVNNPKELESAIFGQIFGGISDIEIGSDGYLYVISIGQGKIFKIIPS